MFWIGAIPSFLLSGRMPIFGYLCKVSPIFPPSPLLLLLYGCYKCFRDSSLCNEKSLCLNKTNEPNHSWNCYRKMMHARYKFVLHVCLSLYAVVAVLLTLQKKKKMEIAVCICGGVSVQCIQLLKIWSKKNEKIINQSLVCLLSLRKVILS